jgi:transcription elongation factor Elf1
MPYRFQAMNDANRVAQEILHGRTPATENQAVEAEVPEKFDTKYTDEPVCPHCGDAQSDASEIHGHCETARMNCGSCEKEFESVQDIQITYSTHVIDYAAEAAREEQRRARTALLYAECQKFPPGMRVRLGADSRLHAKLRGQEGVVANRELSRHNPMVHVVFQFPGKPDYETVASPEDLEVLP